MIIFFTIISWSCSLAWADYYHNKFYATYEVVGLKQYPFPKTLRNQRGDKTPNACLDAFGKQMFLEDLLQLSQGDKNHDGSIYKTIDLSFYVPKRGWVKNRAVFRSYVYMQGDVRPVIEYRTVTARTGAQERSRQLRLESKLHYHQLGFATYLIDETSLTKDRTLEYYNFVLDEEAEQMASYLYCSYLSDECCELNLLKVKPEAVLEKIQKLEKRKFKKEKLHPVRLNNVRA